jgi:Plasmid encoded RepA protein
MCTEAIRTKERRLMLGRSLLDFMRKIGITSNSGGSRGDRARMKEQIDRLFNCHIDQSPQVAV